MEARITKGAHTMQRHWSRLSTWLVILLGLYQVVNAVRAFVDAEGFAAYMGLPLTDPANDAFVKVYALRTAFIGLCVLALLARRNMGALFVFSLVAVLMPVGDAVLTALNHAPPATVARHGATAVVVAVTAWMLANRINQEKQV